MFFNPQSPIGQVIGGYQIERMLNTGATGAVFLGRSTTAPQTLVAIKLLVIPWNASPEDQANFRARFRREAQTLQQLHHPHILPLLSFGEEAGLPYMVLPYMEGGTLATRLAGQGGPLPLNEVASYLAQIAGALDFAHQQNIVHRDIKPVNILLDTQGQACVADFSIVRFTDVGHTTLTGTGHVLGTPAYLAPEMATGELVGPAADIYSLGVVIYELVTGRTPFQATSLAEFVKKHAQEAPPAPRLFRPDLPEVAAQALLVALAKSPADRFRTAGAFARALQAGLQGQSAPTLSAQRPNDGTTTARFVPLETVVTPKPTTAAPSSAPPDVGTPIPAGTAGASLPAAGPTSGPSAPGGPGWQLPAGERSSGPPVILPPPANPSPGGVAPLAPMPDMPPRKRRAGLVALVVVLLVVLTAGGSLSILGLNGTGPLAPWLVAGATATTDTGATSQAIATTATTTNAPTTTNRPTFTPTPLPGCKIAFSDPFTNSLNPQWQWVDPVGDVGRSLSARPGFLKIVVPAGRDLYSGTNFNAPRLLQSLDGDFVISVTVDFTANATGGTFQGAGLIAWQDTQTFSKMIAVNRNGTNSIEFDDGPDVLGGVSRAPGQIALKLQRSGGTFIPSWLGSDGSWHELPHGSAAGFDHPQVGIVVLNNTGAATEAYFTNFTVSCT